MTTPLGRLEKVNLREAWPREAGDFTPWLAGPENLALLGEAVGLDLELDSQECAVGPFRADILCRDTLRESWILIENQLERTDHTHLGQILTYAAGLDAVTVIWIAERFTAEHRAALDWLNQITTPDHNFFGLEIELWRIGNSEPAPKFNIVCQPNDWSKAVAHSADAGDLSENRQLQFDFWTEFVPFAEEISKFLRPVPPRPSHSLRMPIGRSGFRLAAIASSYDSEEGNFGGHELRAELVITHKHSSVIFDMLIASRAEIEAELGEPLTWHTKEGTRMCRIYLRRSADLNDRNKWPEYHQWLVAKLDALHAVFRPRIMTLEVPVGEADD